MQGEGMDFWGGGRLNYVGSLNNSRLIGKGGSQ